MHYFFAINCNQIGPKPDVRTKPVYQYGFLVPRNHDQAMELDLKNGNTKWRDAEKLEMKQLQEYNTFIDKGKNSRVPQGLSLIHI